MRAHGTACLCALLAMAAPASAEEAFPGQVDLAAGMACHRNLDMDCARARLESALAAFSPEADPDYMSHVRSARLTLAGIHVAADDLQRAEQEFATLLLLDPDFRLPPGDHPPKLRYVFEQALEGLRASAEKTPHAGQSTRPDDAVSGEVEQAPGATGVQTASPAPPFRSFCLAVHGRLLVLFGRDADSVASGPGAALAFAWRPIERLELEIAYGYSHHSLASGGAALQTMSLGLGAGYRLLEWGPIGLQLGGSAGALAMGTADRYDHWGLLLAAHARVAWPARGLWGIELRVEPSAIVTADEASFFLTLAAGGVLRW
ncbi:MAG: hypothetical protein JXR96_02705 [Deltaproteobacteria bacterium]|nr:hypothetical protein [Deltaproteobacteria bacterium]